MTKKNVITQERLKELINYDQDTGLFTWDNPTNWRIKQGSVAGNININHAGKKYCQIKIDGVLNRSHRLAWLYVYGKFPDNQIDHINGDGTDNRICNLRDVTSFDNAKNARKRVDSTSGTTGISWNKLNKKWVAHIQVNLKRKWLGCFEDINDAISARKLAEIKYNFHMNHGQERPL